MPKRLRAVEGALAATVILPMLASAAELKIGARAPEFALPDQQGQVVRLSDFKGKKNVVLAFYVLAFTGG
jgi:cytochrome oxidase Cu insertion factor (SCO1/SenC/PrrC family)